MTRQDCNIGDPVIVGTIPEGVGKNNKARKISLQHGHIVQVCDKFAAVDMGKFVECFSYDMIQRG
jgi:hypothetical protein